MRMHRRLAKFFLFRGSDLTGDRSLQQSQRPLPQIKEHLRIVVLLQAVDLDAVLAEAGITGFDGWLVEIRHRKAPFTVRRAASDDETATHFLLYLRYPSHATRGHRFIDSSVRVCPLHIAGRRLCPCARATRVSHARRIRCSVARGPCLRPCGQWSCIGARSHPPRRKMGDLAFRRDSAHSSGHAHRYRPELLGAARSTTRLPRFHDLYGSRFGRPCVSRTWRLQARSVSTCRMMSNHSGRCPSFGWSELKAVFSLGAVHA